jgi:hypothetical protein
MPVLAMFRRRRIRPNGRKDLDETALHRARRRLARYRRNLFRDACRFIAEFLPWARGGRNARARQARPGVGGGGRGADGGRMVARAARLAARVLARRRSPG